MKNKNTKIGKRVILIYTDDFCTKLKPGDRGTITHIDDTGTHFVDWDDGSKLGLLPDYDIWAYV